MARIGWVDDIKAIAIISVIWMHSSQIVASAPDIIPAGVLLSFSMPLFVFVSGYCAFHGLTAIKTFSDFWSYLKKLAYRIGVPNLCFWLINMAAWSVFDNGAKIEFNAIKFSGAVICLILVFAIHLLNLKYSNRRFSDIICIIVLALTFSGKFSSFWFLPFAIETGAIAAFAVFVSRQINCKYIFPIVFFPLMWIFPSSFHATMELSTYYCLGLLFKKTDIVESLSKSKLLVLSVATIIAAFFLFKNIDELNWYHCSAFDMLKTGKLSILLWRQSLAVLFIVGILACCKLINPQRYTIFSNIGAYTLAIYPIHAIFIHLISIIGIDSILPHSYFIKPLVVFFLLVISYISVSLLSKKELSRSLLCGRALII